MHTLRQQFRHNAWCNERVGALLTALDPAALQAGAAGAYGSLTDTLKHFVGVEDAYLTLIEGRALDAFGSQETYFAHDLAWFIARSAEIGTGYQDLLASSDGSLLDRPLTVPWIAAPLTVRDGLIQVLAHSAQHRAQILSLLGAAGRDVPNVDYVFMLEQEQSAYPLSST